MANTFKFGNGNWAVKDGYALAYNDENNNFKPLPFDFTRASSATRVNKQGLVETVPSGKPRIDFTDNTSGHLLLEPSRTNLINYSEAISNTPVKSGTFTDNFAISPDGSQNATKLTAGNTDPYFYQSVAFTAGDYTASIWVKGIGGAIGKEFRFAISNETHSSNKYEIPSEWTRFEFTATITTGTFSTGLEIPDPAVSGDEVLVWGWQVEAGSYATSYIPTEGASVTRVADSCSQTTPSGVIGQTEGTIFVEMTRSSLSESFFIILSYLNGTTAGSYVNSIYLYQIQSGSFVSDCFVSNSIQFSFSKNGGLSIGTHKIALSYKQNDFALYIDGIQIGTDNNGNLPTMNYLTIGGGGDVLGHKNLISETQLYNTRLSNSELAALTQV